MNADLQAKVLDGTEPVTCRPADLLEPELERETNELLRLAAEHNIQLADDVVDDVLTFSLFPQIGLKFLENRDNPDAFEPAPSDRRAPVAAGATAATGAEVYSVRVNGKDFTVEVAASGKLSSVASAPAARTMPAAAGDAVSAVLAGNIFKVHVTPGQEIAAGDPLLVVEAMKMETTVSAPRSGTVTDVYVSQGDMVAVGDPLVAVA